MLPTRKPVPTLYSISIKCLRKHIFTLLSTHNIKCISSESSAQNCKLKCERCRHLEEYVAIVIPPQQLMDILLDCSMIQNEKLLRKAIVIFWNNKIVSLPYCDESKSTIFHERHLFPLLHDDNLYIVTKYENRITHLTAGPEFWTEPRLFKKVLNGLTELNSLEIIDDKFEVQFDKVNLKHVVDCCPNLRTLNFFKFALGADHEHLCYFYSYLNVNQPICKSLTEIHEYIFPYHQSKKTLDQLRNSVFLGIQNLPNLRKITIAVLDIKLLAKLISEGKTFPKYITEIKVSKNDDIKDVSLVAENCKEINSLNVHCEGQGIIPKLKLFSNITKLIVRTPLWVLFESYLNYCGENISQLCIWYSGVPKVDISQISHLCPNLKYLQFSGGELYITDTSAVFSSLEEFLVYRSGTSPIIDILKLMPNLRKFTHMKYYFTDAEVQILINSKMLLNLQHLHFKNLCDMCSLQSLEQLINYFPNLISFGSYTFGPNYVTTEGTKSIYDYLSKYVKENNLRVEIVLLNFNEMERRFIYW